MERKVSSQHVKIGMYISGLDRPWLDTPFLMQGFNVMDDEEVSEINKHCNYVYIDTDKGAEADTYLDDASESSKHYLDDFLERGQRKVEYQDEKSSLEEYPEAESALNEAVVQIASIMDSVKSGDNLDVRAIRATVQPMLESMIRNVDALLWMLQVKENESIYNQAIDNCAIGIAYGRHLGLHPADMREIALGMLLLDVGKIKIAPEILNKPGSLTREEFAEVKKHVDFGVEILREAGGVSNEVVDIVQTHHERFDGSGYPAGLVGKQIPIFGLVAAIIDTYNAMTRKTPYREAIAPHHVLQELYKWRDKFYHRELVEQFLQCMGVYPTGSLVEMTSGEVGVVVAQNSRDRLRPTVSMILDELKNPWEHRPLIDLATNRCDENGLEREILRALNMGAYGISNAEIGIS